jgi:hypothetical protein
MPNNTVTPDNGPDAKKTEVSEKTLALELVSYYTNGKALPGSTMPNAENNKLMLEIQHSLEQALKNVNQANRDTFIQTIKNSLISPEPINTNTGVLKLVQKAIADTAGTLIVDKKALHTPSNDPKASKPNVR